MGKNVWLWSSSRTPEPPSISGIVAASLVALTTFTSLCGERAWADQVCGPAEAQYVEKLAAGMQQFAPKVTKTGGFAVKEEYPGDGTEVLVVSFVDRGKSLFVHRLPGNPQATATTMRPGKTKSGEPGFVVALLQGKLGACEYSVFVHDGKFLVASRGFKR